ncbi:12962_t:CDS:2, partial [Cetraspora pellucida]
VFSQTNLTGNPLHVLAIRHYQDDAYTSVVHIGRRNYIAGNNLCLEPRLLLRVLQGDGSVTEINFNNTEEIQDINYCYVNSKNPISIYPLFGQYILVSYVHANDTSNTTTYMDRGMVIDWNGNIISIIDFGPSYLFPNSTIWRPIEFLVNNIVPKRGFLRLSGVRGTNDFRWSQYAYSNDGRSPILIHADTFITDSIDLTSFQITALQTLDGGYMIVYSNTLITSAILYAMKLKHNKEAAAKFILYQLTQPNMTFTNLFCSVDYIYVGHSCIASVINIPIPTTIPTTTLASLTTFVTTLPAQPTISTTQGLYHLKIRFLSSGSVLTADHVAPNENSANIRTLPLGGYALILQQQSGSIIYFNFSLYNENNQLSDYKFSMNPIITSSLGVFDILQNNTMLVAQNESSTALNLISIELPPLSSYNDIGYGNFHVNATYPQKGSHNLAINYNEINITFQSPVSFANGNLSIYQISIQGDILRQIINWKNCVLCTIQDNVVKLNVYESTFNEPDGQYYIQMDNNFVQNSIYDEAILGIDPYMWIFRTDYIDINQQSIHANDIYGSLRLTTEGTRQFIGMADSTKSDFIATLIDELTVRIPAEKDRLGSTYHYQFDITTRLILISFYIRQAKSGEKLSSIQLTKNLKQLIKNGASMGISTGTKTNYLDSSYGFQSNQSIYEYFELHKTKFIVSFAIMAIFLLLFVMARFKSPQ